MTPQDTKRKIEQALQNFAGGDLAANAISLFERLGYRSEKRINLSPNTLDEFLANYDLEDKFNPRPGLPDEWESVDLLFQLTDDEIMAGAQLALDFGGEIRVDDTIVESYLVFAVALRGERYTRTQLAGITREINKLLPMPVLVLFKHGECLTLAVINRRLHKRDPSKDVLEKITLIKDIAFAKPHRAHVEILFDLSLPQLLGRHDCKNFVELHNAWQQTLDSSELNKRFFKELANWYFWAVGNITFPTPVGTLDLDAYKAQSVIRLITRLIFVWFIKEKGLAPEALFRKHKVDELLNYDDPQDSTYYKAILQNLFFATLNQEMNTPEKPDNRKFRGKRKQGRGRDQHHLVHNVYRYERYFKESQAALDLLASVPFLNGGLFECLDKTHKERVDGFSDRDDNPLCVPDFLFFAEEREVDLNAAYGTRNKRYTVRGLLRILDRYKFTVTENTPVEEEVALDPELLGRVFENLLAAYNPETSTTARKQTGSFYTPREIVNYMVDESLIAYLQGKLDGDEKENEERLRQLVAYSDQLPPLSDKDKARLIEAIDTANILDPACGSGAFLIGILQKLVYVLSKLDPGNERWKATQLAKLDDVVMRSELERVFRDYDDDYGRKLYLIENCIYGVDIQPIAVQIAKLRCLIALIVDQTVDDLQPNRGIIPLPNLETKFVATNSLLGIRNIGQISLRSQAIIEKEQELARVRREHFNARTPATKAKRRAEDALLRAEISAMLANNILMPHESSSEMAEQLAYWDPYDHNTSGSFFDPEWMFGIHDGFDITIGNPPYVRADSGEAHLAMRQTIMDSGQYKTLWEKWDLYIPFIELGYKLLRPGGVTTMIVSDAYCQSKYAEKSQVWFLQNSLIRRLDFLSKIKIFDASVRNIIYLFQKADGQDNEPERRVHVPEFGVVSLLPTTSQRELTNRAFSPEGTVAQQFPAPTCTLDEICYISVGMVVHADEKQSLGLFRAEDVVSDKQDDFHPKPYIEGKDILRWGIQRVRYLEYGTQRAPALFRRPTFQQLHQAKEKLLAQRMCGESPVVTYDDKQLYSNHTVIIFAPWHHLKGVRNRSISRTAKYLRQSPEGDREKREEISQQFHPKYLMAIMNSTFARDWISRQRRSKTDIYPNDWKQLPIPDVSSETQAPIVILVDQILAAKRADPQADVSALERGIDRLVYQLYGLAEAEIAIVEGGEE